MKRGRKSFAEHDKNFISRICDPKTKWPWPSLKVTLSDIQKDFEQQKTKLSDDYWIKLYNHAARKWNEFLKERASKFNCQP